MRSIMRSARIALYKSKKLRIARGIAIFTGSAPMALPVTPKHAYGERDCATVNGHLHVESGIGKIRLSRTWGISPCIRRRRIETTSARYQSANRGKRPRSRRNRRPKTNRRPESVSNPGRRLSTTGKQPAHPYRCAAALLHIMPMPRSPAPSPASRVHCPDRCRHAGRRAALPTSRPRPPRSSCRPRWWPSAPCRGTCRRP